MTMSTDFHFRDKIPVAILGATGAVGQKFIELLSHHPWFEITALGASDRSANRPYKEVVNWLMSTPLPSEIGNMIVKRCDPKEMDCPLVFSGLDSSVAGWIETIFAESGAVVLSNSRNHRMDADVPLLIPDVNPDHIDVLKLQTFEKGKIITNPNCSVIGLAIALKPLIDHFGIQSVSVVTMQAISGAGYPGVASLDILDNVIPFISGEEDKIETEPKKILGKLIQGKFEDASFTISAQCNRVPVQDGHTECVSIKLSREVHPHEIFEAWQNFVPEIQGYALPTCPSKTIHYFDEDRYPQPKLHRMLDKGMAISIGRLRKCPILDYKFVLLSHNTIRGAAGGAILNAELLVKKGFIYW